MMINDWFKSNFSLTIGCIIVAVIVFQFGYIKILHHQLDACHKANFGYQSVLQIQNDAIAQRAKEAQELNKAILEAQKRAIQEGYEYQKLSAKFDKEQVPKECMAAIGWAVDKAREV